MDGEFICKYCTAPLTLQEAVGSVVRCVHCGNVQTLPKKDVSPAALSFLRMGEHDLDTCKFDEAYTAYAKAAELDEKEPEAYFGMALASFKVQYLKDEVNNRLQPICHEISEKVFSDDKNFRKALEFATDEQRREYLARAEGIDRIRKEFYALKKSGFDYDCFLCTKVSDEHGGTTQDSHEAFKLYHHLKKKGYAPFYSEAETGTRTGSDYEALILYALYTSECMLIVCSDEEYLQTKWVKNEYTRFLRMLANEEKERDALTFVFSGKPVEKLPSGKKVQGIDLSKPDAYSRIEDFVKNHTLEAKEKREEEEARKQREEEERNKEFEELKEFRAQFAQMMMHQKEEDEKRRKEEEERKKRDEEARITIEKKAQEEAERKKKEEERKRNEEEARLAAEKKVHDLFARQKQEEEERRRGQFEIVDRVLKKYKGQGGYTQIPNDVTSIGDAAFDGCSGITKVAIPNSAISIGWRAFHDCSRLTSITIPNSVTSIGNSAFWGCSRLTNITIPNSVTSIGDNTFNGCSALTNITIPDSVTSIGDNTFSDCSGLTNIIIPNSVTSIGAQAFWGCSGLTNITIPKSVKSIGVAAFEDCSKLKSVTIPRRLKGFMNKGLKEIFGKEYNHIKFTFI